MELGRDIGRARPGARLWLFIVPLLAVPVIRMVLLVRNGATSQYFDYWFVLDRVLTVRGGVDLRGLFTVYSSHPLVLPGLVYWLDAKLTGGSNIVLGYAVIAVALAQAAWLAWIGRRTLPALEDHSTPLAVRPSILAATSVFLLFTPAGAWNFLESMSGAAWLPANLFVIGATWCMVRGRTVLAVALGVIASLSYGTGLMVWPVLLVVGALTAERHEARRRLVPVAAVAGGVAVAYLLVPHTRQPTSPAVGYRTPRNVVQIAGFIFSGNTVVACGAGALAVLGGGLLAVRIGRRGPATFWSGLWLYAVLAILATSIARTDSLEQFGLVSRYASLAALLWVSVVAMALISFSNPWPIAVVAVCLVAATTVAGQTYVRSEQHKRVAQAEFAVAMRIGVIDGSRIYLFNQFPPLTSRLRSIGHYPFDDDFTNDCGTLGSRLDDTAIDRAGRSSGAVVAVGGHPLIKRATVLRGWVDADLRVRCVAVVDKRNRVVGTGFEGAAVPDEARAPHTARGVEALVPKTDRSVRLLVATSARGPWHQLVRRSH